MDSAIQTARRSRGPTVVLLVSILGFLSVGTPASVRAGTPTVTTLEVPSAVQHGSFNVTAHVRPAPQPDAGFYPAVSFLIDGSSRPGLLDEFGDATESMSLAPGTYSIVASFGPFASWDQSESDPALVTVKVSTAVALTSSVNPVLSTQPVTISATVSPTSTVPTPEGAVIPGGTLSIVDAFDGSPIASGPVSGTTTSVSVTRTFATGSHVLTASYSGSGDYESSQSQLTQVVSADVLVDASSFRVDYATFYPVKDGYRDTDAVRGTLNEPASITIRIYSPTGSLVRNANLGLLGIGAYAYPWNGRTSTGSVLPAGKYKVVQRVTDTANNVQTVTLYATLSRKRLIWTSVSKTLYGSQYSAVGHPGTGSVSTSRSPYYRGVRISSGNSWAAVRYTFALHSALVYSANLTFRVVGKSPTGTQGLEGLWNRNFSTSLDVASYDVKLIGPSYASWAMAASSAVHRSRTSAYGLVYVEYGGKARTFDVAKVQLVYRWAILG